MRRRGLIQAPSLHEPKLALDLRIPLHPLADVDDDADQNLQLLGI